MEADTFLAVLLLLPILRTRIRRLSPIRKALTHTRNLTSTNFLDRCDSKPIFDNSVPAFVRLTNDRRLVWINSNKWVLHLRRREFVLRPGIKTAILVIKLRVKDK